MARQVNGHLGTFSTVVELTAKFPPASSIGCSANVGTAIPYIKYWCDGSVWAGVSASQIQSLVSGDQLVFAGVMNDSSATAIATNNAELARIAAEYTQQGVWLHFPGTYYFSTGVIFRAGITLSGLGRSAPLYFVPTVADARLFAWSAESAHASQVNEEGQLVGVGIHNLHIFGSREIRCNGILFNRCDAGHITNLFVEKFKGYALKMSNCREFKAHGYTTRFCGYTDLANGANNVGGTIFDSPSGSLDATNMNLFTGFQPVYSFGPEVTLDGAYANTFDNYVIHSLARADTAFETLFVAANPIYNGAAAAAGWDSGGNPLNEYAAMHVNATGGVRADVSGCAFQDSFAHYNHTFINKTNTNGQTSNRNALGVGRFIGAGSIHTVLATGAGDVQFTRAVIEAVGFWGANVTINASTDIATVDSNASGSCCVGVPLTGTPCYITAAGSPTNLPQTRQYYVIRISSTTMKFATSYANAIAGTAIDIGSTGTTVVVYAGGALITALGGSTVAINEQSYLNDGRTVMWFDDTSAIYGMPRIGTTWSQGPKARQISDEKLIFEGRNISLAATGDKALTKRLGGWRASVSRIVVYNRGTTSSATGVLEFWTSTGGGGTAIAATTTLTNATTDGAIQEVTVASTGKNANALLTMYARCTTAVADGVVDILVYGYPAD